MNTSLITSRATRGFTLVELLIVVIILAILAAIVVPQFASSSQDAEISSLDTNLANTRSVVDLYYQQHGEYPGAKTSITASCPGAGTVGTGAAPVATVGSAVTVLEQLSMYTDKDGKACSTSDATYEYGPYIKKPTFPANPITQDPTLDVVAVGNLNMAGANPAGGWKFDVLTGKFIADDSENSDPDGNTYDTH